MPESSVVWLALNDAWHGGEEPYRVFMPLFTQHEDGLRCFVRTVLPSRDDVDEVIQDMSVVAWMKFDRFDPETDFARCAATIARYEVLNYRRTKARDRLVFDEDILKLLADECQEDFAPISHRVTSALFACENTSSRLRSPVLRN